MGILYTVRCVRCWCKECPLTRTMIMASVFVRFPSEEEGHFFLPDMAWYNVLLNKNRLTKMVDLLIIYSYYRKYAVPLFLGHPVYLGRDRIIVTLLNSLPS